MMHCSQIGSFTIVARLHELTSFFAQRVHRLTHVHRSHKLGWMRRTLQLQTQNAAKFP
jgi:hypothetical protein